MSDWFAVGMVAVLLAAVLGGVVQLHRDLEQADRPLPFGYCHEDR